MGEVQRNSAQEQSSDARQLAGGGGIQLIGGAAGQGLRMVVTWFLSGALSVAEYGVFAYGLMIVHLTSLFAPLGVNHGILLFGARYLQAGDRRRLKGALLAGFALTFLSGILCSIALWCAARFGWLWADKPDYARALLFICPAVALNTVLLYLAGAIRGAKDMRSDALFFRIGFPAALLAGAVPAVLLGAGLRGAQAAFVAAFGVSLVLMAVAAARRYGALLRDRAIVPRYELKSLLGYSLPQGGAATLFQLVGWMDMLMLGWLATAEQVGLYRIGSVLALMGALPVASLMAMFNPVVTELLHAGELRRLDALLKTATRWLFILAMPFYLALLCGPRLMLSIFDEAYLASEDVLQLLVIGQCVFVICTPAGRLIPMSGRAVLNLGLGLAALALNLALNASLIPRLGGEGAAIASAVTFCSWGVARTICAGLVTGCWPLSKRSLALLVGAVTIIAAARLVDRLELPFDQLLPTVMGVALYAGLVWVVGRTPQDGALVVQAKRRFAEKLRGR